MILPDHSFSLSGALPMRGVRWLVAGLILILLVACGRLPAPANADLQNAELILPLSQAGQKLYDDVWQRFLSRSYAVHKLDPPLSPHFARTSAQNGGKQGG